MGVAKPLHVWGAIHLRHVLLGGRLTTFLKKVWSDLLATNTFKQLRHQFL